VHRLGAVAHKSSTCWYTDNREAALLPGWQAARDRRAGTCVPGEAPDERGDLWADWPSARAAGIGPLPGDQATMPPQDGIRGEPVRPQLRWPVPDQRGHDGPVGPVEPGSRVGAAQDGDLVPEHQQLRVLGR